MTYLSQPTLAARPGSFDVVLIRLPDRWEPWFTGNDDFNLRHFLKATAARRGVATQIIGDNALTYADRCSVMWRLSIALYTKAGGVPWKLAETRPRAAFIGLGCALRTSADQRFVRCAAQVFDDRGAGLHFVGYTAAERDGTRIDGENPFLTRQQMHGWPAASCCTRLSTGENCLSGWSSTRRLSSRPARPKGRSTGLLGFPTSS